MGRNELDPFRDFYIRGPFLSFKSLADGGQRHRCAGQSTGRQRDKGVWYGAHEPSFFRGSGNGIGHDARRGTCSLDEQGYGRHHRGGECRSRDVGHRDRRRCHGLRLCRSSRAQSAPLRRAARSRCSRRLPRSMPAETPTSAAVSFSWQTATVRLITGRPSRGTVPPTRSARQWRTTWARCPTGSTTTSLRSRSTRTPKRTSAPRRSTTSYIPKSNVLSMKISVDRSYADGGGSGQCALGAPRRGHPRPLCRADHRQLRRPRHPPHLRSRHQGGLRRPGRDRRRREDRQGQEGRNHGLRWLREQLRDDPGLRAAALRAVPHRFAL